MNGIDRLTEELRHQAESLPDQQPLTLADVQGRARGIRRRRYAVTGLAAAAVLAVSVPLGLAAGDRLDRTSEGPVDRPGERRSLTEDPTPTPTQVPRRISLTTDVDETTAAPTLAYLAGGEIHLPDGSTVAVDDDDDKLDSLDTLVPLGLGYVVGGDSGGGERFTAFVDASGDVVWSEPSVGQPVVSPSGRLVAFGRENGTTLTVEEDGQRHALMTRRPDNHVVAAVVDGSGSSQGTCGSCTVWSNSTIALSAISQTRPRPAAPPERGESIDDLPALVEAVSMAGELALTVSRDPAGGLCSAVVDPDGQRRWRTCDWRLGAFSPDGRFLLGYPLEDGEGVRSVALLDARDGAVVHEFLVRGRADVFVRQAAWDAGDAVLATVWDTGRWEVLRMGVDGSLASMPLEGLDGAEDRDAPPVFLATHL